MTLSEAKEKLLDTARNEMGYKEGYNNYIKYAEGSWDNQFYGWELQHQPWCDVFVDWCFTHAFTMQQGAAMTYQTVGRGSALCRTSAQYYKNNNAYYDYPEVGDQIFFYYSGAINHTGIVESVKGSGSNWTSVTTIEGNANEQVQRSTYKKGNSILAGFGRPKWSVVTDGTETPEEPGTLRYGMYGSAAVKEMQQNLIKLGYNCGTWGADGDFGDDTLKAVKKFQSDHSLTVDGVATPKVIAAIATAANGTPSEPTPAPAPLDPSRIQVGDKVKIKDGATYYNSAIKVPYFILVETWIVYSINGDRVVINRNVNNNYSIMSPIALSNLVLEGTASAPADPTPPSNSIDSGRTYTVKSGDSLWAIAQRELGNGLRYGEIKKLNNMTSNLIHAGDILKLPKK